MPESMRSEMGVWRERAGEHVLKSVLASMPGRWDPGEGERRRICRSSVPKSMHCGGRRSARVVKQTREKWCTSVPKQY